ncbi:uncharacterized protein LOC144120994 isoform X13 [Amblyomma americanum]
MQCFCCSRYHMYDLSQSAVNGSWYHMYDLSQSAVNGSWYRVRLVAISCKWLLVSRVRLIAVSCWYLDLAGIIPRPCSLHKLWDTFFLLNKVL